MAQWHHLTHKRTGETQVVASLGGIDLDDWKAVQLPREPKEDERVVEGKIAKRPEHHDEARGKSSIVHLTLAELNSLIDARILSYNNRITGG